MDWAIELDGNFFFRAIKIKDKTAQKVLSSEFFAKKIPIPQVTP
jgi:hypothetical protein